MGEVMMSDGWTESADAWIADMGEQGDFGRACVLDRPMLDRVAARPFATALDIGCGEGRFCRQLAARGVKAIGIDPTEALIAEARRRDPAGDYRMGRAEALDVPDGSIDLVVSYLSLIDIPDIARAIAEMARVLRPGGVLLIANLTSFNTAGQVDGWQVGPDGTARFAIDHYLDERAEWVGWRGIHIQNWHRPLSTYMALLLGQGLVLTHFAEPSPYGGDPASVERYRRAPWFLIMEWRKPAA
ncbi:class I SAM-dependent methyltransferase [Sphingomonas sp. ZT3P38]|uniref:class I SAM-dependent methyltransferase n=1 Tax=Parasphingomonas zepuensis TaxID=3096161 RepID=UPI002FC662C2